MVVGIGFGGISTLTSQHLVLRERGWKRLSPFAVPAVMPSGVAAVLAIRHAVTGPVLTVSSACASGTQALGEAYRLVRSGLADLVLAGGAEAPLDPVPIAGFERMDAMSTRFDDPARASGPFDRDRDGFVVGEGTAFFVLGTEWAARALGVTPYGEIVGYGLTTNAHHLTAPSERGAGAARCMEDALSEDRRRAEAATHVNAHGTSTPANDAAEAAALTRTAGPATSHPWSR